MADEDTLHEVAQNGCMDYAKWPAIIEPLLDRLTQIVYHEFPMPQPYPIIRQRALELQDKSDDTHSHQLPSVQISQTPTTPRTLPPVPPFPGSSIGTPTSQIPNSQPDQGAPPFNDDPIIQPELPILLQRQLSSITATLQSSFSDRPPHTIQRLSELTLDPKKHYKTLPAWLRAVDRVVSVSSTADIFPLTDTPAIVNGVNGDGAGGILWENNMNNGEQRNGSSERDGGLGSDESLGGALLTPIPWLRDVLDTDSTAGDMDGSTDIDSTSPNLPIDDLLGDPITFASEGAKSSSSTTAVPNGIHHPQNAIDSHTPTSALPVSLTAHPSSNPLVPDRPLGAVTQGELIRMEQEAGVVPVSHPTSASSPARTGTGRIEHAPSIALGIGIGLDSAEGARRMNGAEIGEEDGPIGEIDETVHARGPDVVGTVDMGLVGGKDIQVRIGSQSPPSARPGNPDREIDVNDAQNVLAGGDDNKSKQRDYPRSNGSGSGPSSEGDYVDVSKELSKDEADDAMQMDNNHNNHNTTTTNSENANRKRAEPDEDEDIVLVDADGATEEERKKIDSSDLNVGSGTTR